MNISGKKVFFEFIKIEWTENDIQTFTEALEKFNDDWTQIANYVQRSEQSCRAFYQKYRQKRGLVDDERVSRCERIKKDVFISYGLEYR